MLGHAKNSYFKNFFVILYKIKLVAYHAGRMYTNRWQNMNAMFAQITFQWCLWHTLVMNLQGKGIKTCHIDEKKSVSYYCSTINVILSFLRIWSTFNDCLKHSTQFDYYIQWYIYSLWKLKLKSCSLRSLFFPFFWKEGMGVVLCTGVSEAGVKTELRLFLPVGPGVCSSLAAVVCVAKYCQTLVNVSKHFYINER